MSTLRTNNVTNLAETGNPTGITPAASNNSAQYATTEYADRLSNRATHTGSDEAPAWSDLTLVNSWSAVTGFSAQYRKHANGQVEVRGSIKKATTPVRSESIATLPSGHRPNQSIYFTSGSYDGTTDVVGIGQVTTNGEIKYLIGGHTSRFSLDGIRFTGEL